MASIPWKTRAKLFVCRFWQPTSACMACMPGSLANAWSVVHWSAALQTGIVTGTIAVLLTMTPARVLYRHRFGRALVIGALTAFADVFSHPNHYGHAHAEALLTGAVSFAIAWVGSYLYDTFAGRIRVAWSARFGGRLKASSDRNAPSATTPD